MLNNAESGSCEMAWIACEPRGMQSLPMNVAVIEDNEWPSPRVSANFKLHRVLGFFHRKTVRKFSRGCERRYGAEKVRR